LSRALAVRMTLPPSADMVPLFSTAEVLFLNSGK